MANKTRTYRVAEQLRSVLAASLLHMNDPRFELVTLTHVKVSADLGHAKVYWTVSGTEFDIDQIQSAFDKAAGYFKRTLGQELELRTIPQLRFYYDDTLDTAEQVERLLASVQSDSVE